MENDIEHIIHEMLRKVKEEGHEPITINLTREAHDQLAIKLGQFDEVGYYVKDYGVVYFAKRKIKDIFTYLDIPVNITSDFISVTW